MTRFAATGTDDLLLKPVADVAGRLGFAATPTFALIAWISASGSPGMTMCFGADQRHGPDVLLMSLFHLSPWLKFLSHRFAAPHHPN